MKIVVESNGVTKEEVLLDYLEENEGVYVPAGYEDVFVISIEGNSDNVLLYISSSLIEELDRNAWEGVKFIKLSNTFKITI